MKPKRADHKTVTDLGLLVKINAHITHKDFIRGADFGGHQRIEDKEPWEANTLRPIEVLLVISLCFQDQQWSKLFSVCRT